MHDVSAVPATIARDKPRQRNNPGLIVHAMPRVHALVEFLHDRREHERTERIREERREIADAEPKKQDADRCRSRHWNEKLPLQIRHRRSAPSDQRSYACQ